jgi:tripartite-type tricarboxylate transporter receptor subunit TctC
MHASTRFRSYLCAKIVPALCCLGAVTAAYSQSPAYPAKAIRMIVPFAAGGSNDTIARLVGQKLTAQWGQPVVVENRGGAGGTIGVEAGVRAPADGYTLIMSSAVIAISPALYDKLSWDPVRDLTAIGNLVIVPAALSVNPHVPARSVAELVTIAKSKQRLLSYGSSGVGAASQLAAELFKSAVGADIVNVSYKGTALAITDLIAGQIDIMFADIGLVIPLAKSGKLRLLAVAGTRRATVLPQLPTIAEAGVKGYDAFDTWIGVTAPAGVPKDLVARLNAAIVGAITSPDVKQRMDAQGYDVVTSTPEQFAATIKGDTEKFRRIIKSAGLKAEL